MLLTTAPKPAGFAQFVTELLNDPVAAATLLAAFLALVAAVVASMVAGRGIRVTRTQGDRESGMSLYTTAVGWMYNSGSNPSLALEGVRTLTSLLNATWASKDFREMSDGALRTYTEPRSESK